MSSTLDLKVTIDNLLSSMAAAKQLKQCLQKQGDVESVELVEQILEKLAKEEHDIRESLPDYVFDRGVLNAADTMHIAAVHMFPTHLDTMLRHHNVDVRLVAVRCGDLNKEQLQNAIGDRNLVVREAAKKREYEGNKPYIVKTQTVELREVVRIG